jgi:photosystem II stability/assembly factor-like uncharacterized protein
METSYHSKKNGAQPKSLMSRNKNKSYMKKPHIMLAALLLIMSHTTLWAQWQNVGSGISSSPRDIFSISAVNENVIWAVATNPSTFIGYDFTLSIDGGTTWSAGLLPDTIGNYYPGGIYGLDAQTAWALMIKLPQQDKIRIFKTNNGGSSWQEQPGEFNTSGFAFASMHFFNSNEGIGFGSPGTGDPAVDSLRIYRTIDGGDNWARISPLNLPAPVEDEGVWVYGDNRYESKGDTLWFFTRASRVFRTTDKGQTWQAFNASISGNNNYPGLSSIAFKNSMEGIVTTFVPSQAAITSDGGVTWSPLSIPTSTPAADIEYVPGTPGTYIINEGWLTSGNTSDFLITQDNGNTWYTASFTPAIPVVRFLSPTVGFAGGAVLGPDSGGIYKWTGDITLSINNIAQPGLTVEIYPNPAKDKLVIQLPNEFPLPDNLTLGLINVVGQTIKQVSINSKLTNIELGDLPEGIYFYQLRDEQNILTTGKIIKK